MKRIWIVLTLASMAVPAFCQGYRLFRDIREDVERTSRYKIGSLRISPSFGFRDIGYDSNVYYEAEDQEPTADYMYTIFFSLQLFYLFHDSVIISFREIPEYVHYFEEKRERGWNNIFAPEIRVLLFNHLVLSGSYLDSKRRYRATAEFNSRVDEYRKGVSGNIFYETARGTSLGVSCASEEISYGDIQDAPLLRSLNRKELEANFEFYYRLSPETFFFLREGYKEYGFVDPFSRWRDAYSYQAYTGIQFPLFGRIRGVLALGYKNLVPRKASKKEFLGFVGNTSLDIRVWRLGFRLGFIRDSYFSYWSNSVYFVENRGSAGLSFYLARFLRIDYDFSYGEDDYPEDALIISPAGEFERIRRYNLFCSHAVGLVIRIIKNTGVGFAASYWKRESNLYFENRKRLSWGAYLTYDF